MFISKCPTNPQNYQAPRARAHVHEQVHIIIIGWGGGQGIGAYHKQTQTLEFDAYYTLLLFLVVPYM